MDGRLEHNLQDSCKNEIFGTNHYYPFGMETEGPWYLQRTGVQNHYRYNGKENIGAIGLLDYGARNYDSSIGRFLSVDPLADHPQNLGWNPYHYTHNNPINMIDPTGMKAEWVPDENGNLIAEQNDNAQTLATNYGYTEQEAQAFIDNSNVKLDANGNVVEGQTVNVENRFTQLTSSQSQDEIGSFNTKGEVHNCHGVTCNEGGYLNANGMDYHLDNSYQDANGEMKSLETVIRWGGYNRYASSQGDNTNNHTATIYGFSSDGTMYLTTANGPGSPIQFTKFQNVNSKYGSSTIKGTILNPNFSGYFNPR